MKVLAHQSLHEADLMQILSLAERLDQCPEQVVIFGIQPEVVEMRQSLSPLLLEKVDAYLAAVRAELDA